MCLRVLLTGVPPPPPSPCTPPTDPSSPFFVIPSFVGTPFCCIYPSAIVPRSVNTAVMFCCSGISCGVCRSCLPTRASHAGGCSGCLGHYPPHPPRRRLFVVASFVGTPICEFPARTSRPTLRFFSGLLQGSVVRVCLRALLTRVAPPPYTPYIPSTNPPPPPPPLSG